ncbi:DUF3879 family protein [Oceanobacillus sp. CFH 90083]|uniref:DUF3879 family protein n=1 Tax=Oceanobacillus sp. CFH 90083 TaxID=2592336 RepID=UPI00128C0883|nr:DUF3879 family protein [Oceanobacillus sp. CFH 90083]
MNFSSIGNLHQSVKIAQMKELVDSQSSPRYPGTYDNDPMNITNRTDWKKIVPVPDKVKQDLINAVKETMEQNGGMRHANEEKDPIHRIKQTYLNSLPKSERLSASWTLTEIYRNEAQRLVDFVRVKDPSWDWGKPVKTEILEEVYKSPNVDIKV